MWLELHQVLLVLLGVLMVKVHIEYEEEYPLYRLVEGDWPFTNIAEITTEDLERWKRVQKEFFDMQDEMGHAYTAKTTHHHTWCLCAWCSQ